MSTTQAPQAQALNEQHNITETLQNVFEFASPSEYIRHNNYMLNSYVSHALKDSTADDVKEAVFMTNLQNEFICELFQSFLNLKNA